MVNFAGLKQPVTYISIMALNTKYPNIKLQGKNWADIVES